MVHQQQEDMRMATCKYCIVFVLLGLCQLSESRNVVQLGNRADKYSHVDRIDGKNERTARSRRSIGRDLVCQKQEDNMLKDLESKHLNDQYNFKNISTSAEMTVAWAGENDGVLLAATSRSYYYYGNLDSTLFRSVDDGKTFENISSKCELQIRRSYGLQQNPYKPKTLYVIGKGKADPEKVVMPGAVKDSMCITEDGGNTFKQVSLPFTVYGRLRFHTSEKYSNYIMYWSEEEKELCVTFDNGHTWKRVAEKVSRARWGYDPRASSTNKTKDTSKTLLIQVVSGQRTYIPSGYDYWYTFNPTTTLLYYDFMRSTDGGESWTTELRHVIGFGEMNGFVYASQLVNPNDEKNVSRVLLISKGGGLNGTWNVAQVPTIDPERFYSILDMEEGIIFLHVDDREGQGTLYTSGVNGVVFTESLKRHMYMKNVGTDFYKVQSMRGVYITSQVSYDKTLNTLITYNRGATWQKIRRPENVPCRDETKECNLHLYLAFSDSMGYDGALPLSETAATGLILAHGYVAESLQKHHPDVYVSSDGGYSWQLAIEGPHEYSIADHGGILVAVSTNRSYDATQTVKFSTDEGRCWHAYNFTDSHLHYAGILSEPGAKSQVVSVWGKERQSNSSWTYEWQTNILNFQTVISRQCGTKDYESWEAHSDYRADENKDVHGCLLGVRETFERLKKDSWCYNGYEYERTNTTELCKCTREDYDCDFGYERDDSDVCKKVFHAKDIDICLRGHEEMIVSEGYIKISGDKCQGGFLPNSTKIRLNETCKGGDPSLVIHDMGNATKTPTAKSQGKSHSSHTIVIIVVVAVVLVIAVVITIFGVRKVLSNKKREHRYTLMNHTDDDEFDDDQGNNLHSTLSIRTEPESEEVLREHERQAGDQGDRSQRTGYHDDSDDDLIT